MNYSMIFYIIGWFWTWRLALLVPSLAVSLIYHESCALAFFITIVLCLIPGVILVRKQPKNKVFYAREGSVTWCLKLDRHEYHGFHPVPLKRIHHNRWMPCLRLCLDLRRPVPVFFPPWNRFSTASCSGGALHTGSVVWEFSCSFSACFRLPETAII